MEKRVLIQSSVCQLAVLSLPTFLSMNSSINSSSTCSIGYSENYINSNFEKQKNYSEYQINVFEDTHYTRGIMSEEVVSEEISINNLNRTEQIVLDRNKSIINEIANGINPWESEGVKSPNLFSINNTNRLLMLLADKKIFNYKISQSIEEGIMVSFKNNSQRLYFEIYNDGQFGYIIEDFRQKSILENKDVDTLEDFAYRVSQFLNLA